MSRRRHQSGSLFKINGSWTAKWNEGKHRRKRVLGRVGQMTKAEALCELAKIVAPINSREIAISQNCPLRNFIKEVYLPFYELKWKRSTAMTNRDRIGCQPVMPVEVDLQAAWQPGGDSHVAQPQFLVDEIEIVVQALAVVWSQERPARCLVVPAFVGRTRLHR